MFASCLAKSFGCELKKNLPLTLRAVENSNGWKMKPGVQMYGNFEVFPEKMVHVVWVGVLLFDSCTSGPISLRIFHENAGTYSVS